MENFFLILFVFLIIKSVMMLIREMTRPANCPPGPIWLLPFIGSSRYMRKLSRKLGGQYKAFNYLSKQYNSPIISVKLGRELIVVGLTYDVVKEILTREEFDGRPDNFFLRLRTMETRLGITCTDGKFWHDQRNFVVRQLRIVGFGKSKMEEKIQEELAEILEILRNNGENPISPGGSNLLATSVINVLWTFTTGSKIKRDNAQLVKFLDLLQKRSKAFDFSGGLLNQMPWLRFFAPEAIGYNLIKKLNAEFNKFFMAIVEEHLSSYSDEKSNDDLIYAYIREIKERENESNSTFTLNQLIMVILDLFIGGAQTTSITIDLALMTMLTHPEVQKKVHQEIDSIGDSFSYSDRQKLPYIEAVLLEVQRYYHIVPITGPRRTLKDTKLGKFTIPKDTTVLISLETVSKDEMHWKDPLNFRPERFLDENNKIFNTERLMPFAAGHRRCLGDQLAKECLFTFFVGILKNFELEKCENELPCDELVPGILLSPKPYKIIFKIK